MLITPVTLHAGRVLFADQFTDANGTGIASHAPNVGTSWTSTLGAFQIQSNTLTATAEGHNLAKTNSLVIPDYTVSLIYTSGIADGFGMYIGVRDKDDAFQNYVNCGIESDNARMVLYEVISGVSNIRSSAGFTVSQSTQHQVKVRVSKTRVDLWVNSSHISYTGLVDTTSTKVWVQVYQSNLSTSGKVDNLVIHAA